jgi:hypothetical protein
LFELVDPDYSFIPHILIRVLNIVLIANRIRTPGV